MNHLDKLPECFVAMWFGSDSDSKAEMDQLYDWIIKPAIEQQGLLPYHVGRDLGADKLDDAILEAIDRAVLVVVDLTHDPKTGLRGSVVFEAGYAYKTKPIIWMCRDDLAGSTPFDIRQFRQIRWNGNRLTEAKEQLADVIRERIGERRASRADHEMSRLITSEWQKIMSTTEDLPPLPGESEPAVTYQKLRFKLFQNLCGDISTRVKYKEMGLSQDEKYELMEMLRGFNNLTEMVETRGRVLADEHYDTFIYPSLRASGWLKSGQRDLC